MIQVVGCSGMHDRVHARTVISILYVDPRECTCRYVGGILHLSAVILRDRGIQVYDKFSASVVTLRELERSHIGQ